MATSNKVYVYKVKSSPAFQMGAHGLTGGAMSVAQDGSFGSGFLSGAISLGLSSGASGLGVQGWGMVGIGGLGGGIGSPCCLKFI